MRNIPFKARMLIAFVAIFLLPLLVIGIPGGVFITRSAQERAIAEAGQVCAEAGALLEARLARMDGYMQQVSHDSLTTGIMNMRDESTLFKRYTAIEYDHFASQLRLMLITTDAFDDLVLCFPQQDFVLTQRGTYSIAQLFRHEFVVDGMDDADWLASLDAQGQANRFMPVDGITTFGVRRSGLLYACVLPMKYERTTQFAVIYFLSAASLDQAFGPSLRYSGMTLSLIDDAGTVRYRLLSDREADASETLLTWSFPMEQSGLLMEITIPRAEILTSPTATRNAVLLILALMGALGGALSAFVAHLNYRPLEGLFTILYERGTLAEQHPSLSGIRDVERTLATLLNKDEFLQQQLDEYHDLLQYAVLARLLDGSLSIDAAAHESIFGALNMPLPYRFLSVGVFYRQQADVRHLPDQLRQAAQLLAYPIEQDGRLVILINHAGEDAPRQLLAQPGMPPLAIGLSAPCVLLGDVHRAYREALYAVNYRPVRPQGGAVFYADVYDARSNYFFPAESEHRLLNLLRAGDAEGAREAFAGLLSHNLQDEPAAYVLHRFFDSVAMSVFRQAGVDQGTWEQAHPPLSPDAPVEAMMAWMDALLGAAAEKAPPRDGAESGALLRSILAYIDENLCDPQLSLGSVAEQFGVSTSHLSRYIKKTAGVGYLDLVNRKRILMAKSLLRNGDMSVKHIAASVGFDSDVTLRRLFKKYEGVAPTQYAWEGENP